MATFALQITLTGPNRSVQCRAEAYRPRAMTPELASELTGRSVPRVLVMYSRVSESVSLLLL